MRVCVHAGVCACLCGQLCVSVGVCVLGKDRHADGVNL